MTESLLYRGYCVARVIRSFGKIVRIIPVTNIQQTKRDPYGKYIFTYLGQNGGMIDLPQDDAFFSFYSIDDNMLPVSPILMNRNSIGLGMSAEKMSSKTFKSGGRPSGVLEIPGTLGKGVKEKIKEGWDFAYGPNGDGGVAVLEGAAKYAAISMTAEAAQLIESRQFQKQDICGIFGVPPHMIGDTAQAKGWSTMEQMMTEFLTLTINPISIRFEQSIDKQMIDKKDWFRKYSMFDTRGLLRADTGTRKDYYATGLDKGWLEINEVRKLEDMNPLPPERIAQIEDRNKNKGKANEQQASTGIAKAA
jgi:HK97 family phage portal protein